MERVAPALWQHQEQAIQEAEAAGSFMFAMGTGTGKTRTLIETLKRECNRQKRVMRILIICPPIVISNWRNEWLKYTNIEGRQVTELVGSGKKRLEIFQKNSAAGHIFISNYESLLMEPLFEAWMKWKPEAIAFDECHRLANYKSSRTKLADKLANKTNPRPTVYMLSATPVTNSMMDVFSQFKVLDGGATFGDNFFAFRAKYFRDKNAGMNKHNYFPNWVPLPNSAQELSDKMRSRSMRVKKEDCLDLPPLVETTLSVEMDKEQRRIYDNLFKDYVAFFERDGENHAVMAQMAMTKGLRLMQIASGFVKTDEGVEMPATSEWTPKQTALYELLEDLPKDRKVILWAVFKYNYKQIREVLTKLGRPWLEMNGDYGPKKNREAAALFEASNDYPYIIGHPESAGEGINLVSASEMVSYSRDFSWRRWEQLGARNYRGGSNIHDKITRYILVAKDTIEEKITKMLCEKQEISEAVLKEITFSMK